MIRGVHARASENTNEAFERILPIKLRRRVMHDESDFIKTEQLGEFNLL